MKIKVDIEDDLLNKLPEDKIKRDLIIEQQIKSYIYNTSKKQLYNIVEGLMDYINNEDKVVEEKIVHEIREIPVIEEKIVYETKEIPVIKEKIVYKEKIIEREAPIIDPLPVPTNVVGPAKKKVKRFRIKDGNESELIEITEDELYGYEKKYEEVNNEPEGIDNK
jgi:hypothetical protein